MLQSGSPESNLIQTGVFPGLLSAADKARSRRVGIASNGAVLLYFSLRIRNDTKSPREGTRMAVAARAPTPVVCIFPQSMVPRPKRPRRLAPRLSVIIVNHRQWENTANLVRQLRRSRAARKGLAEIIVVDNHSPPNRLLYRLRHMPGVSVRRWGRNHGFAKAVNEGCRLSRGKWFLLLNPDMSVADGFLDQVLARARFLQATDAKTGIVGFRLRNSDGSHQFSAGYFPSLLGTLTGLAFPRARRKYCRPPLDHPSRVDWVTGCCLLVGRDCFADVGRLDESYFLYYEDVDLCRRARTKGWSVWYDPKPSAVHFSPLHCRRVEPWLRIVTRHSLLTYAERNWPTWQFRLLAGIVRTEARLRRIWAKWRDNGASAQLFHHLDILAAELAKQKPAVARRRLQCVLNNNEIMASPLFTDALHHHSLPQPG